MDFRIADTFTDSLARLPGGEQKAVKTTAFDLQLNPASPGMSFHKLDKAKDKNFWSVRVNSDIRLIVHRTEASLLLCYVDHHDDAYRWAERRKIENHPKTGAAQLVEIRETVKEITIPKYVEAETPAAAPQPLFAGIAAEELLGYGVPREWMNDVQAATAATLFALAERLPHEAAEALLDLATGGKPQAAPKAAASADPFKHPDAQRRFHAISNLEELQRALDCPWEKWTIFLHPAQTDLVSRNFNGPARVSGSAGTGKTIVALHRAVFLARRNPDARILLTTFSETLANALRARLRRLIGNEPLIGERLEVHAISSVGLRLYEMNFEKPRLATREHIQELLASAAKAAPGSNFTRNFLWTEWHDVVGAWQIENWEEYRDVQRLGRKTKLGEKQRILLWSIFDAVRRKLGSNGMVTQAAVFSRLAERMKGYAHPPFDFVVVDEAQDIGVAELRFLSALGAGRPNSLFFTGDLGQRIFQQPFSWKALGVDIRGRSHTLKINYRTSHQIRRHADNLLPGAVSDVDGNIEGRRGAISVFEGSPPIVQRYDAEQAEIEGVGAWIAARLKDGIKPHEMGVFVRSEAQIERAAAAVKLSGATSIVLSDEVETRSGAIAVSTMHLAKGLEFRAAAVMACDDEVIPLQQRMESIADEADLEEVYNTERQLLYVACTRARDYLAVTGVKPASEFLDDLKIRGRETRHGK